jgi:septal ring factor EnvC (AmiA/AmiB activator)
MMELDMMRQEVYNLRAHINEVLEEQEQLREAMRRQMNDIDRLIEEKRQLERDIDQKNAKIYNM